MNGGTAAATHLSWIACVYDALRMKRSYKSERTHDYAVQYIFDNAGKHFDPLLVTHFKKIHHAFDKIWQTLKDEQRNHSPLHEMRILV